MSPATLRASEDIAYKKLSSGMKSRLMFSVACLVKPEILILDEVFSVGDAAFRKKSESKMKEIINSGAITLFVFHSLAQVRTICNKALWIEKGKQIAFGEVNEVCDQYVKSIE